MVTLPRLQAVKGAAEQAVSKADNTGAGETVGQHGCQADAVLPLPNLFMPLNHSQTPTYDPVPPAGHAALEKTAEYAQAAKEAARTVSKG